MKLKTRLCISFCAILFVPMLLVAIVVRGLFNYQLRMIEQTYNIELSKDMFTHVPIQLLNRSTKEAFEEMSQVIEEDTERMRDVEYLSELEDSLKKKGISIAVRVDDVIIFSSENITSILNQLPQYKYENGGEHNGILLEDESGNGDKFVKQKDFVFPSDKAQGSVFVVKQINQWIPEMKLLFIEIAIAVVFVLVFTASAMTMWIFRSILKPLNTLKTATHKIKSGDLNFVIEVNEKDEIGQLCSDFEEMRKRLKESAEAKIQFDADNKELISNISHDLKTPITAIKGYVEGIMDGVADTPEKMERYIRTIYNKANDMDHLIDELTFYSKIDTNRIPYTFSKINVAEYFGDCAEELGLDLESKNIEFGYYNYCDRNVIIIADAEQIKRVINNIIGNSVKYIDKPQGKINIRIKDVGDFVQIEIEDNGKGIAQKDIPYIFERFYRTDSSRNSTQGGSGIGLSIVRKIIEDHGGKIWATSREGTGTIMYFVLRKYQEVTHE